jgi:hypothetical protein
MDCIAVSLQPDLRALLPDLVIVYRTAVTVPL